MKLVREIIEKQKNTPEDFIRTYINTAMRDMHRLSNVAIEDNIITEGTSISPVEVVQ